MSNPESQPTATVRLVLFDLDGTFADTAPDMAYALNQTLELHGYQPLPLEIIRPHVSHGGIALIRLGFKLEPEHPEFPGLRQQFLDFYRSNLTRGTRLFPGIEELIEQLETREIAWGIVTNKPGWLTDPLMEQLQIRPQPVCIVSGDTTAKAKPHPEPIFHACDLAGTQPGNTLYVGDAERDIIAGNSAGTRTLTALFGYIGENDRPHQWQADGVISHPLQILEWLELPDDA
jgi:phosphoglycolate phosphatase